MAKIKLLKRLIKRNSKGKINYDTGVVPSRSFVIAFLANVEAMMSEADVSGVTDTGNTARTLDDPAGQTSDLLTCNAPDNVSTYGIQVGSGNTSETNTDYVMETPIADGMGAGQLEYGNHSKETTDIVGSNVDFQFKRVFSNNTGSNVTVREIGMYCRTRDSGATTRNFCVIREVVSDITVADMETLEVIFIIRTTV